MNENTKKQIAATITANIILAAVAVVLLNLSCYGADKEMPPYWASMLLGFVIVNCRSRS
jgi:hypothetical protein